MCLLAAVGAIVALAGWPDGGARVIAEVDGPKTAGVNSVRWNMQARREAGPADAAGGRGGRGISAGHWSKR